MAAGGITLQNLPRELPFDTLNKITDNFSEGRLLGTGAFGSVYEGVLEDGRVAVKKLVENAPVAHEQIFATEVQNMMVLEHENIVKLVAFCREKQNRLVQINGRHIIAEITETLLCYEFFPNGSVDKKLFGDQSTNIDWETRFTIIMGICEGIHFLHTLPSAVLHLGLKPQNIFLDDEMTPKIADFGFSRIFGQDQTRKNTTSLVGSVGYMAPEYLYKGEISARSDIYSLGLIILEICTGKKNSSSTAQKHARNYIEGVKKDWNLEKIMKEYTELDEQGHGLDQVEGCIKIGLQCVEIDQQKRPNIEAVLEMLNGLQ